MVMPAKMIIIAALPREVRPLLRQGRWRRSPAVRAVYGCFESDTAVVICAGIGAEPARRAAQAAVRSYSARILVSAGLAGALSPQLKAGRVIIPATIVQDGTEHPVQYQAASGPGSLHCEGTLVSSTEVRGPEGKQTLAARYQALAVDMEAAAVAEVAAATGVAFMAIKAISDEHDFPMPEMGKFVTRDGRFRTLRFMAHVAVRPAIWSSINTLASNSSKAAAQLCRSLMTLLQAVAAVPVGSLSADAGAAREPISR